MTPIDDRSLEDIEQRDLLPFVHLIERGKLDGLMPAHVVYSALDNKPAVFSSFWLQTVLRQKLGFQGIIFSDDLCMEGASVMGNFAQRAERALEAGCDMILVCNNREASLEVLQYLEQLAYPRKDRLSIYRQENKSPDLKSIRQDARYIALSETMNLSIIS
jgi:beta-N-acetylhexosaminidase